MSKLQRLFGWTVNVLLVIVSVALVALYALDYFAPQKSQSVAGGLAPKLTEHLTDIDWRSTKTTALLALSTKCVFCERSAEFHRRLAIEARDTGRLRLIAVFPQQITEAKQYLAKFDIPIEDVRSIPFSSVGIPGTPALYQFERNGNVVHEWMGKVSETGEAEIFMKFFGLDPNKIKELEPIALQSELDSSDGKFLLDVRTRAEYAQNHIKNAINIPWDELQVRALDELPESGRIFVYSDCSKCGNADLSYRTVLWLSEMGFRDTTVLKGGLDAWTKAGLPTTQ